MEAVKAGNAPFAISALEGKQQGDSKKPDSGPSSGPGEREKLKAAKETIEKMIANAPEFKDLKEYVDIKLTDEGLKIDLLEAKESLFFDSASAKVKPEAKILLSRISAELGKLPNKVIIEGHTDNRPLARTDGYTNWELSADRANAARTIMGKAGLSDKQIAQVRGFADTQSKDPAHPEHFSNRRVSIVVVMNDQMKREQFSMDDIGKRGEGFVPKH